MDAAENVETATETERTRVLVIEDEDLLLELVRDVLSEAGYEVVVAENGIAGLEAVRTQPLDLVITDILMPEMEGVETILEIRRLRPNLRIIAMSGGGRMRNLAPLKIARKMGADAALPKPFEPDQLLEAVSECLSSGQLPSGETAAAP